MARRSTGDLWTPSLRKDVSAKPWQIKPKPPAAPKGSRSKGGPRQVLVPETNVQQEEMDLVREQSFAQLYPVVSSSSSNHNNSMGNYLPPYDFAVYPNPTDPQQGFVQYPGPIFHDPSFMGSPMGVMGGYPMNMGDTQPPYVVMFQQPPAGGGWGGGQDPSPSPWLDQSLFYQQQMQQQQQWQPQPQPQQPQPQPQPQQPQPQSQQPQQQQQQQNAGSSSPPAPQSSNQRAEETERHRIEIEQLRNELERTRFDLENTRTKRDNQKQVISDQRYELEQMRRTIDQQREELEGMRDGIEQQRAALQGQRGQIEHHMYELEAARMETDGVKHDLEVQRVQVETQKAEGERKAKQLQSLDSECARLEQELSASRERMRDVQDTTTRLVDVHTSTQDQYMALKEQNLKLKGFIQDLTLKIHGYERDLVAKDREFEGQAGKKRVAEEAATLLKGELKDTKRVLKKTAETCEAQQQLAEELQKKVDLASKKDKEHAVEMQSLAAMYEDKIQKIDVAVRRDVHIKTTQSESIVGRLQEKLNSLAAQFKAGEERNDSLSARIGVYEQDLMASRRKAVSLKEQLAAERGLKEMHAAQVLQLQVQLQAQTQALAQAQAQAQAAAQAAEKAVVRAQQQQQQQQQRAGSPTSRRQGSGEAGSPEGGAAAQGAQMDSLIAMLRLNETNALNLDVVRRDVESLVLRLAQGQVQGQVKGQGQGKAQGGVRRPAPAPAAAGGVKGVPSAQQPQQKQLQPPPQQPPQQKQPQQPQQQQQQQPQQQPQPAVSAKQGVPEAQVATANTAPWAGRWLSRPPAQSSPADLCRKEVTAIYEKVNPSKMSDLPKIFVEWKGREDALLAAVKEKYKDSLSK